MRNGLGIRVGTKEIYYSIIEEKNDKYEIVSVSRVLIPAMLDTPNQMSFIKSIFLTMINQYKITSIGLKRIETNVIGGLTCAIESRLNFEGVLMELFTENSVKNYFLGRSSNTSSVLGVEQTQVAKLFDNFYKSDFKTDYNTVLTDYNKESVVMALASLEKVEVNE